MRRGMLHTLLAVTYFFQPFLLYDASIVAFLPRENIVTTRLMYRETRVFPPKECSCCCLPTCLLELLNGHLGGSPRLRSTSSNELSRI